VRKSAIEVGVYFLFVPGLLLFLCMFAALAGLLPAKALSTRLAGYGALAFFVMFAAAGVLSSTTASTFGFYSGFEDPTAVTVFAGATAGYHLLTVHSQPGNDDAGDRGRTPVFRVDLAALACRKHRSCGRGRRRDI
jgi:hypothetical protein